MAKGDSPNCPAKDDGMSTPAVGLQRYTDVSLVDAPILLLFYFHNAVRQELSNLHRLAVTALESVPQRRELIIELRRRFQFLQLVEEYHSAVEDEVIFLALDAHTKNVAHGYSLEHESMGNLVDSVYDYLDSLMEGNKDDSKPYQELVLSLATMESCICHHMLKEEEQVYPLLLQQFSPGEQASLVWQFFIVIPVMLLEELLPWMISFLCLEKQVDVVSCIREIAPPEKSLQEVVNSWLRRDEQSPFGASMSIREEVPDKALCMRRATQLHFSNNPLENRKKKNRVETSIGNSGIEYLHILQRIILKDLEGLYEEARGTTCSSCLRIDSVVVQLKFLSDIIIFYSHALKKFVYPVLNESSNSHFCDEHFLVETPIELLHQLLQQNAQNGIPLDKHAEKLCYLLESFLTNIRKWFYFQEVRVFPLISKSCSTDKQQQLLHMSLHLMPLGLLKCAMPWLAAHLTEIEASSLLNSLYQGDYVVNKYFASLLVEWFSSGYSPKTPHDYFGNNLRSLPEKITCTHICAEPRPRKIEMVSANKGKMILSFPTPGPLKHESCGTSSYASEVNLHLFFPGTKRSGQPLPQNPGGESSMTSVLDEPKPADIIFFAHKALMKDLDYLISGSAKLSGNMGFLAEFSRQFNLLCLRYHFHTTTEDEIAFPSLEMNGKVQLVSLFYSIDHKLEDEYFNRVSLVLEKLSDISSSVDQSIQDPNLMKYDKLCMKLHQIILSMHRIISDHMHHEEMELWPLFRKISIKEQEKIIGQMLGGARAETIQDLIPWLIGSLTLKEKDVVMSLLHQVTKNTMFDEWLAEWMEGHDRTHVSEEPKTPLTSDPLEIILKYLPQDTPGKQGDVLCEKDTGMSEKDCGGSYIETWVSCNLDGKEKVYKGDQDNEHPECEKLLSEGEGKKCNDDTDARVHIESPGQPFQLTMESGDHKRLLTLSQDDLEVAIRKASSDPSLDPQKKSYVMQYLQMSRWIVQQQISKGTNSTDGEKIPGQYLSYSDSRRVTLGCQHYKRNCKLVTPCCNKIYTCIRCHDDEADHLADRRAITQMMCMKCLVIQPIGKTCISPTCNKLSMGRYYCRICKLFDDAREIYHCPYCNICRVGKGLGVDYFHCMNCNACMARSLKEHTCREKILEANCPICHEFIFTSSAPVKSLPCGHLMHSACFEDYTNTHYVCPICSKSLGDMQVYFKMLDIMMAEMKMPDEYVGKTQAILCNDCEKKGLAAFHWHYHKCPFCGSYNTRLL